MKQRNKTNTGSYVGQLIQKPYVSKIGQQASSQTDLFLRLSMGDFFIKFSESSVSREELSSYMDQHIEVKGELREGEWDSSPNQTEPVQSRIGPYLIITEWIR